MASRWERTALHPGLLSISEENPMRMSMTDWGQLALLSVLWGGAFFFAAVAVREVPPLTVVLARVSIAAVALWVFLSVSRRVLLPRAVPRRGLYLAFLGMGLMNNVIPFSLLFWAQTEIASGLASILNATTPIFSAMIAHLALQDERLSFGKLAGVLMGAGGVAILAGFEDASLGEGAYLAMAACLAAALSYGIASVIGRRFRRYGVASPVVACGQLSASTVILLPMVLIIDAPWTLPMPSSHAVGAIVGLALLSTALAYILFFRVLASAGAVAISLVTVLIPVTAVLLGTMVLHEPLLLRHGLGMAVIAFGLVLIDGRLFSRL